MSRDSFSGCNTRNMHKKVQWSHSDRADIRICKSIWCDRQSLLGDLSDLREGQSRSEGVQIQASHNTRADSWYKIIWYEIQVHRIYRKLGFFFLILEFKIKSSSCQKVAVRLHHSELINNSSVFLILLFRDLFFGF